MIAGDGKTYGLPQDTGPLVYFYNQKAFESWASRFPKTKDELIEAAKTAAASGKYIMDYEADEAGNIFVGLANASDRGTPSRMTLGWSTPTAAVRRLLLKPSRN